MEGDNCRKETFKVEGKKVNVMDSLIHFTRQFIERTYHGEDGEHAITIEIKSQPKEHVVPPSASSLRKDNDKQKEAERAMQQDKENLSNAISKLNMHFFEVIDHKGETIIFAFCCFPGVLVTFYTEQFQDKKTYLIRYQKKNHGYYRFVGTRQKLSYFVDLTSQDLSKIGWLEPIKRKAKSYKVGILKIESGSLRIGEFNQEINCLYYRKARNLEGSVVITQEGIVGLKPFDRISEGIIMWSSMFFQLCQLIKCTNKLTFTGQETKQGVKLLQNSTYFSICGVIKNDIIAEVRGDKIRSVVDLKSLMIRSVFQDCEARIVRNGKYKVLLMEKGDDDDLC